VYDPCDCNDVKTIKTLIDDNYSLKTTLYTG
jgi:hypothetical protein